MGKPLDPPSSLTPLPLPDQTYFQTTDVENLQHYGPGKLHPIHLHDRLNNNRFVIVAKLDHTNHTTSWLCRDMRYQTWRRIDIVHASPDIARTRIAATREALVRRYHDGDGISDQRGLPLEAFQEWGPNGEHHCVVLPLNGEWGCFRRGDKVQMNERWFVREGRKLRGDGEGGKGPGSVHEITEDEMVGILGRPRVIEVTRELWESVVFTQGMRREQVPMYLVLRPEVLEEDMEFWLSGEGFER